MMKIIPATCVRDREIPAAVLWHAGILFNAATGSQPFSSPCLNPKPNQDAWQRASHQNAYQLSSFNAQAQIFARSPSPARADRLKESATSIRTSTARCRKAVELWQILTAGNISPHAKQCKQRSMRQRNQKVYYSILAICYLEVLLWTTCLLSSCAAVSARPEDAGYIIRETGRNPSKRPLKMVKGYINATLGSAREPENLKHTLPSDILELLQDSSIDLRIGYQAQQLEWLSLQRSFEATFPPETEDRPATFSFLPVLKGIPAPFSGVKAWSDLALSHL